MASRTYMVDDTVVHICAPDPMYFVARVRIIGHRKYTCGPRRKKKTTAMRDMLRLFEATRDAKRADVIADYEWYGPSVICELVKR